MAPALLRFETLPSTMEAAHREAAAGAPHGTAVVARVQEEGRGTRGRSWASAPGGLWLSVIARPHHTEALEGLSLKVGVALAAALELHCPMLPSVGIKWPNDLVVDGRKLAGILCEARWLGTTCQWVIVGLGLNVRNELPAELAGQAARLCTWDPAADEEALAEPLAGVIALAARDAGPLSPGELAAFARRDILAGTGIESPVRGIAEGITPAGALRVRTEAGPTREILAGVVPARR